MLGETISHYRILEELGKGGMGEVYLAEDTRLGRKVALKFLAPELARDRESLIRFRNEAKAAAELSHPNIATIHDIGEDGGKPFLVLEYLEGQTLRERLAQGPLPIDDVLRIGMAIATGLAKAHSHGIVHRDIKSANVILTTEGEVKILDFGLAHRGEATQLTRPGTTLGTIGYMSPEQAAGELADERSDIWSLGVVLYECLTGALPFSGQGAAVIEQIQTAETTPPTALRTGIPLELERVVLRCLEKDASLRHQHADDLIAELRLAEMASDRAPSQSTEWTSRSTSPGSSKIRWTITGFALALLIAFLGWQADWFRKEEGETGPIKIAVLPFENLGASEDEYFADGITDEITSRLAVIPGLAVISRTSAKQYKNTDKGLREIGQELGVEYILEGTIRWDKQTDSETVRITPQLITVSDDSHLWAENYDRELEQIFAVQAEIASQVAGALNITLLESQQQTIEAKPTENLEAYQAYLRGLEYTWGPDISKETLQLGVQMFERSVELDSEFALSYAMLSEAHSMLYHFGHDPSEERLRRAKAAVDKALEFQPDLPETHLALAWYHYRGHREYSRALDEAIIAQNGLPYDSRILLLTGAIWRRQGKFDASLDHWHRALELSPQDARIAYNLADTYRVLRRFAEADRYYALSISFAPDQQYAYKGRADNYISWLGDTKAARNALERMPGVRRDVEQSSLHLWRLERNYNAILDYASSLPEPSPGLLNASAAAHRLMGGAELAHAAYDSARSMLELNRDARPEDPGIRGTLGVSYAGLGRREEAIREGKRAVELYPISKDEVDGSIFLEGLAEIYTMVGEYDAALNEIEHLLSIPSWFSVHDLRLDPRWDPLRDHPRYQALVDNYAVE